MVQPLTRVCILGATGSIGRQTLDVIDHLNALAAGPQPQLGRWAVHSLAAADEVDELSALALQYQPEAVCCEPVKAGALAERLSGQQVRVLSGEEGLRALAGSPAADIVVIAIYGLAALAPLVSAIAANRRIALASKEALVAAGSLLMTELSRSEATLIPIDSEHSALFQCIAGRPRSEIRRAVLTCSGGPFHGKTREELASVSYEQALQHPVWKMGAGISINSATLFNKGLELLEAQQLFGLGAAQLDVLVHPQGLVHGMIEFTDGAVMMQSAQPDMRLPIQYALTWPRRFPSQAPEPGLASLSELRFGPVDTQTFPALAACRRALSGPWWLAGALVAVNEELCRAFQDGRIGFLEIGDSLMALAEASADQPRGENFEPDMLNVIRVERAAREWAAVRISGLSAAGPA
jgi:1-deoxy-D-xylulose-5-phosphate reductoisomerase